MEDADTGVKTGFLGVKFNDASGGAYAMNPMPMPMDDEEEDESVLGEETEDKILDQKQSPTSTRVGQQDLRMQGYTATGETLAE